MRIAQMIDHTYLKAEATRDDITRLAEEAKQYQFASVVVNPVWVPTVSEILRETTVKVCTVIGFPLGAATSSVKAFETKDAIQRGAQEVDMVIDLGALKGRDDERVEQDIRSVVDAAEGQALVKVIIETALLTDEEKERACRLAVNAGADFVKTSTGFSSSGAKVEDVALMRKVVGSDVGVKASGGIRTYEQALSMIEAGATRIGTSNGVSIVKEAQLREKV
jgi:deoxyribose-phosphate aldolase